MEQKINKGFQSIESPEIAIAGVRKIVVLGDPGCTRFTDDSKKILGRILARDADLFFIVGDLTFTGDEEEFREIIDFCNARVNVPVFALRGNHDLFHYSKFLGRDSYALVLGRPFVFFFVTRRGIFPCKGWIF